MTIGFILLLVAGGLILFGAGQRVLDRLRLTDRQAILFIVLIIAGGFLPEIPVTRSCGVTEDTSGFFMGGKASLRRLVLTAERGGRAATWWY